jgi:hypothetical protein
MAALNAHIAALLDWRRFWQLVQEPTRKGDSSAHFSAAGPQGSTALVVQHTGKLFTARLDGSEQCFYCQATPFEGPRLPEGKCRPGRLYRILNITSGGPWHLGP